MSKLKVGTLVNVASDAINAYLQWRGQPLITGVMPGKIAGGPVNGQYLVKLNEALPVGTEGAAKVKRTTVTASAAQLKVIAEA